MTEPNPTPGAIPEAGSAAAPAKRSRTATVALWLSIGMLVLYAALAVGAANCLTLHADQPGAHHHGQSHLAHSALCARACQLNPAAIVGTPPSLVAISSVMAGVGHAD